MFTLCSFLGIFQSVAFSICFDNVYSVCDSVEQGSGQSFVAARHNGAIIETISATSIVVVCFIVSPLQCAGSVE